MTMWRRLTRDLGQPQQRPLRFLLAGGFNTLFAFAFFPALVWASPWMHRHYLVALGLSQAMCVLVSYAMQKTWVFRVRGFSLREMLTFSGFSAFMIALSWVVLPLGVEWGHLSPYLIQFVLTLGAVVGSWFWHNLITFAPRRRVA